jgi:chromosome segregation ATPase
MARQFLPSTTRIVLHRLEQLEKVQQLQEQLLSFVQQHARSDARVTEMTERMLHLSERIRDLHEHVSVMRGKQHLVVERVAVLESALGSAREDARKMSMDVHSAREDCRAAAEVSLVRERELSAAEGELRGIAAACQGAREEYDALDHEERELQKRLGAIRKRKGDLSNMSQRLSSEEAQQRVSVEELKATLRDAVEFSIRVVALRDNAASMVADAESRLAITEESVRAAHRELSRCGKEVQRAEDDLRATVREQQELAVSIESERALLHAAGDHIKNIDDELAQRRLNIERNRQHGCAVSTEELSLAAQRIRLSNVQGVSFPISSRHPLSL